MDEEQNLELNRYCQFPSQRGCNNLHCQPHSSTSLSSLLSPRTYLPPVWRAWDTDFASDIFSDVLTCWILFSIVCSHLLFISLLVSFFLFSWMSKTSLHIQSTNYYLYWYHKSIICSVFPLNVNRKS